MNYHILQFTVEAIRGEHNIEAPAGSQILSAAQHTESDNPTIQLWVKSPTDNTFPIFRYTLFVCSAFTEFADDIYDFRFINTIIFKYNTVLHVFEKTPKTGITKIPPDFYLHQRHDEMMPPPPSTVQ